MTMAREPMPDVVVLLPGILGSVLQRDGKDVWALSGGALFRGLVSLGKSVRSLALDDDDPVAEDLGDGVTAPRLMPDLHMIPGGFWKIDGYGKVADYIKTAFEVTEGQNYFEFPYDWRRDNRAHARRLERQSNDWLGAWKERSGSPDPKLVLVCHSLGGLIARYFIEVLGGWKRVRALITFGTPFYGSLNAVNFLSNGFSKGIGPLKLDLSPLLRSLTSVHQLLPIYRCIVAANGDLVSPPNANLPGYELKWLDHLTAYHREIDEQAELNRKDPAWESTGMDIRPIVGIDQPTNQSAVILGDRVELRRDLNGDDDGGDSTVPRISAAISQTQGAAMYTPERHASIQTFETALLHVKGVISALHGPDIDDFRAVHDVWFSLDVDDVYESSEPVAVTVAMRALAGEGAVPTVSATVTVTDRDTHEVRARRDVVVSREPTLVDLGPMPRGVYQIAVAGPGSAAPLEDVFVVFDEDEPGVE